MTIELITGTPGAGKTTYAVAMRMVLESKRSITLEGGEVVERRLLCAGFRGLVVSHERLPHKLTGERTTDAEVEQWNVMLDADTPKHQRLPGQPPVEDVPCLVQNWWLWCKPGDLICIDEVQFIAPRGVLGRKPPYWIQALEIHRHYGVDFIVITQHPQLIDTTIRNLVGLHRHVRSVMGSCVCMVYAWDHASNTERFNLANKSTFVRRRAHYRLFHSTVAVIKPPASGRSIVVVLPILFIVGMLLFNHVKAKLTPQTNQESALTTSGSPAPLANAVGVAVADPEVGRVAGCYILPDDPVVHYDIGFGPVVVRLRPNDVGACRCFDGRGAPVLLPDPLCRKSASSFDGVIQWESSKAKRYEEVHQVPVPGDLPRNAPLPFKG